MEVKNNNKVNLKIFIWALGVITLLIAGLFTMSGSALQSSHKNEIKINAIEITESLHYNEIIKILERIEDKLK